METGRGPRNFRVAKRPRRLDSAAGGILTANRTERTDTMATEADARRGIIEACLEMNARGLNQNTSGNVSIRHGQNMLISPSAVPYQDLKPNMIASMDLSGDMSGAWEGPLKPSTEWRFHWQLMKQRSGVGAVVHAHAPYCTALAILRRPIPACHYMIAAFGGENVRCAGYAAYGTPELAELVVRAMENRTACLLANHGMVTAGESIGKAMWRAVELEAIARQYYLANLAGEPVILTQDEVTETLNRFAGYGA